MYYPEIKQKAINLRKEGYSYNYIIKHVPVSKSTLSEWLRDVSFTPNKFTLETIGKARLASGAYKHQTKVNSIRRAEEQAKIDIVKMSDRDIMMLGLGVYIGEGAKTHGITRMINSDPKIIKLFITWVRICFDVKIDNIVARLFLYPDSNEKESINYWSKQTSIPKHQFFKSITDRRMNKKDYKHNKLPFGTAHVTVKKLDNEELGAFLHRRIMAWINRVL